MHMKFLQKLYIFTICIIGIPLAIYHLSPLNVTIQGWVLIYILTGSILLLNFFIIFLPPKGNALSMDSSIYLACIFLFGLDITLLVLLLSSLLGFFIRKTAWWKHLFNFSIYTIMIVGSYYSYILFNGTQDGTNFTNLLPYFVALTVYFSLNVIMISAYFFILEPKDAVQLIRNLSKKGIIKESIVSYVSTLLLALVLTILLEANSYFGLFLFISLVVSLSFAFTKFFTLYKEVEEKANKDFLTDLFNHGYFKLQLDEHIKQMESYEAFSVAILDIDDFKKYNDLNGHLQGDELLKYFGSYLKEKTEPFGYLPARYGGEEFTILMPKTDKRAASAFLNKIRKELNDTHFNGSDDLPLQCLSFSAGIAQYEEDTYNSAELLNKADKAMYYAKAQGKNTVQIYEENSHLYNEEHFLLKEIDALEQQLSIFLSKDMYTYQHSKRVFTYAVEMANRLPLTSEERRELILGALIHDIGKLEIPRDIINKKGKLDAREWDLMKKHVTWGKEIMASTKKYDDLIPLVELHHERFDGKGYPYGLAGEKIPKLARILCVIDSFDAMTTERPYQRTKTFQEGIDELNRCAGEQFDPVFVKPFIRMIQEKYPEKVNNN
ncbi:diguanylate cyclase [Sutcliffiella sp. NC1]|nr:diguanylate cyclase [Sutcliffiella sp. NC1]WBL17684.1 diguanylate cyclase [Sutcliffiella sp. NC1]